MKQKKRMIPLLCMLLLLTACSDAAGANTPTPTKEPETTITLAPTEIPAPTEILSPTAEPTATPLPTNAPNPTVEPTVEPTITPEPTPVEYENTATPVPTESPLLTYATVTPVPQSAVVDIVGTMTVDTYPVVDGSTATLPLSEAVFMAATGESAEVAAEQVVHTKTTNSYNRLYNGEVDLLIVYEPAQSIVERMQTEPLCIKPIGLDALVFMANQANPVESLTMEQLVDIYSGKISSWAEVGGNEKELLAFQRPLGSGSQTLMEKLVMGDVEMVTGDNVFRYYTMSDILEGMLSYNGEDNTLGYSVFYYANNMYFEKDLKFMAVNGVLPSTQTIYDGSYSLDNAFYAVVRTDEPADSNARKIFDWLTGNDGQQLVLDLGYVPVQMPEGAVITNKQTEQPDKVELLTTEPLKKGQKFVSLNPQNITSDLYYGDITVYDENWNEVANFYNASLEYDMTGIYEKRYLPIGQIRQNAQGEQQVYYGIYDLEQLEYSVYPTYSNFSIVDAERCYYAVPKAEEFKAEKYYWPYQMINGAGEVLLEEVRFEDWINIYRFGNGYMERVYDYENWDLNGVVCSFYDENLELKKVFCQKAHLIPDDADKKPGVEYYLIGDTGCLVDENAEVLISQDLFLSIYGDGENMECKLPFYSVTEAEGDEVYEILYKNQRYVVDRNLNLLYQADITEQEGENYYFFSSFYEFSDVYSNSSYYSYDGTPLLMSDGTEPEALQFQRWGDSSSYMMYRELSDRFIVETKQADQEVQRYPIFKDTAADWASLDYHYNGYIVKKESYGETIPAPNGSENEQPLFVYTLYYQGKEIGQSKGYYDRSVSFQQEAYAVWGVQIPETLPYDKELVYDEYYAVQCADYYFMKDGELVNKLESAYLFRQYNGVYFLLKGNYMYAIGYDGTEYVKELRSFMALD